MRILIIILSIVLLPNLSNAQFYYGLQTDFGKNRLQYKEFNWTSYQFQEFDTYYYREGKTIAEYTAKKAHIIKSQIEEQLSFRLQKRIQFVIFH